MENICELVRKSTLFQHLTVKEILPLLESVQYSIKKYKKNEVIFSPHQTSNTLGIVLTGSVEVQKIFSSGKVITVNKRYPSELIADASLFANTDCYPSTISACENTDVFLISKSCLLKLFSIDEIIMSKFLESVSNRVLALNHTIEIFSLNSVPAKISYYLLLEYKKQKTKSILLKSSKKSLAEQINVSRPTLSRELKNMQLDGVISFDKKRIELLDIDKLEELCST